MDYLELQDIDTSLIIKGYPKYSRTYDYLNLGHIATSRSIKGYSNISYVIGQLELRTHMCI